MEGNQVNIVEAITQTINNLFSNLFSSVDNSLYSVLDDLLFINADILNNKNFFNILGDSNSNGLIIICNSLLIGFFLYYLCTLILSYFTFSQIQKPSQFIFKFFLCAIAINSSSFLIEKFIYFFSNISLSIREVGEIALGKDICLSTFIQDFNSSIYIEGIALNIFSLTGLIKSFISIGLLNLSISYSIRYIMIRVFILLTPFALSSLVSTNTYWIFKSWFKILLSLLMLQIFVSLILIVSFSLDINSTDMFSKLTYMGCIYSLIKCNSFVRDFMGGLSTDISVGLSSFKNLFSNQY